MANAKQNLYQFEVVVVRAGSASESLVHGLAGHGLRISVVEAKRAGAECPFTTMRNQSTIAP